MLTSLQEKGKGCSPPRKHKQLNKEIILAINTKKWKMVSTRSGIRFSLAHWRKIKGVNVPGKSSFIH